MKFKYINKVFNKKSGITRYYFRAPGKVNVRLLDNYGSPEFVAQHAECLLKWSSLPRETLTLSPTHSEELLVDVAKRMNLQARQRAAKRGLPCTITTSDILEMLELNNCQCMLSGLPLEFREHGHGLPLPLTASLDRINNREGYVPTNVRIVCYALNVALHRWGDEAFARIARAYLRHRNQMLKVA